MEDERGQTCSACLPMIDDDMYFVGGGGRWQEAEEEDKGRENGGPE